MTATSAGGVRPYHADDWLTIYQGDVRDVLPSLPSDSVDCIVTSPPYWGLRDYGSEGQIGLERTPEEYVANLVGVFHELRRILKPSGTCWLNLGDSYASGTGRNDTDPANLVRRSARYGTGTGDGTGPRTFRGMTHPTKPKDLVGIPWRVAFALQADGWYLRSDIIWAKPNPMPESVTDRPTKAHEYLFLLTKSARYYYDADAVREASITNDARRPYTSKGAWELDGRPEEQRHGGKLRSDPTAATARNLRSVWTIATRPYPGAHFAVFPPELPERCIKAGSPELGVILDPFAGSGTTGMVANRLSRRAILIDLNGDYLKQQLKRNAQTPLGLSA